MKVANASLSQMPFHHLMVTRSPNHMCAISCTMTVAMPLELVASRLGRIGEQRYLAERHAPQVLHGAECEVGDRDEVELVARVGLIEVLGEEPQRVRARLEREAGETPLCPAVWTTRSGMPSTSTGSVASSGPTTKATM